MNPYKVLGLGIDAGKHEIIQAAARALRERRFSGKEIAVAQKQLLDPIAGKAHGFIQFIDVKPLLDKPDVARPGKRPRTQLKYLTVFTEEDE